MTVLAEPVRLSLAGLYALRERVQRRLEDAVPYSPDWAAASDHADEIEQEIAARVAGRDETT